MGERIMKTKESWLGALSSVEVKLVSLKEMADAAEGELRTTCLSLVTWYQRHQSWTSKQAWLVDSLLAQSRTTRLLRKARTMGKKAPRTWHLYGVRVGNSLKIGFSSRLKERVSSYATGSADVELLHAIELGACGTQAAKHEEKKLHRFLNSFRIEREIFHLGALEPLRSYIPKSITRRQVVAQRGKLAPSENVTPIT